MTRARPPRPIGPAARRAAAGFNLIEVMVSMGIFVIAFVAVASIFPTAITLQREAAQTVDDRAAEISARAIVNTFSIDVEDFIGDVGGATNTGDVGGDYLRLQPLLDDIDGGTTTPDSDLPLELRTLGANPADANDGTNRRYIMIPMIQATTDSPQLTAGSGDPDEWRLVIAVLRRDSFDPGLLYEDTGVSFLDWGSDASDTELYYPDLKRRRVNPAMSAADQANGRFNFNNNAGSGNRLLIEQEKFIDNNGTIYVVREADFAGVNVAGVIPNNEAGDPPTDIWFAPRPLEPGSNTVRPESRPSPLVDFIDASGALR